MKYPCIDIHTHFLPEVDDGSDSLDQTYKMLRMAYEDGTRAMIATPHYKPRRHSNQQDNATPEKIQQLITKLQQWLETQDMDLELYPGNELYYHHSATDLLADQQIYTLAGTQYLLVEYAPSDDYIYLRQGLQQLQALGYWPILAHVERYETLQKHPEHLEELLDLGIYLQVNAGTILGNSGFWQRRRVLSWIKEGYIHLVASDAHDTDKRSPRLQASLHRVEKSCGQDIARQLYYLNPQKILQGEVI